MLYIDRWSIYRNAISFDESITIDVPPPYWNISNFRATLGHKMNHSFKFSKVAYGRAYHPRFGNIRSIYATCDISKGEEIFANYGYPFGSDVPEWYSGLYLEEIGSHWYSTIDN